MFKPYKGGSSRIIQGIKLYIPPAPIRKTIANYHLPKKEQRFFRTDLPEQWLKKRNEEIHRQKSDTSYVNPELESFRLQEWERRINGYWFFNNGKPTYITGLHYFMVNWWKCDFGYPDFRIPDQELFYFLQTAMEDPNSMGINEVTLRRDGKTARMGAFLYEYSSRSSFAYAGLQSKTGPDAAKVFDLSIILPWKNLPDFFRPVYDYNNTQKSELRFSKPLNKGKKALDHFQDRTGELNSILNYKNSNQFAYDGYKLHRYGADEVGKTEEVNVWERHQVIMPCMEVNGDIIGKAYYTTTVEEMKSGGADFKELHDASAVTERSENGRTKSGLYNYFKPAYRGWKYDKYGFPLEEAAKKYYMAERKARKNDARSLSSYIRKFPFTIEEAFMVDGENCEFNAMVLNERLTELNFNEHLVSRGDFIWKDGVEDGKVVFVHNNTNGSFYVAWLPKTDEETNLVKEIRSVNGTRQFKPLNDDKFAIATDPIDHGVTVDGRRSNAASYGFRKFDLLIDDPHATDEKGRLLWETYNFIIEYIHRPSEPTMYYESMIRLCCFLGCQLLAENQKRGIITHFTNRGYGAFIMSRPKFTFTAKGNQQDTPGIPASKPMIQQYTGKLQTFVEYHGHRIPFKRLIQDLLQFDPNKPTKHDPSVGAGLTLIASEKETAKRKETIGGLSYVQLYDNSGNRSRPL